MMLVDTHCHLDFDEFAGELDDVIVRARAAGVGAMVTICTRISRLERNLKIVEGRRELYLGVSVHPHEAAAEGDVTVERLVEIAAHPKVVAIGETGLDHHYNLSPADVQQRSFRTHCRAARVAGLPLVVHTRNADEDTIAILQEEAAGPAAHSLTGVIHCFSSGRELAERAVALGFYVSLSGILTFPKSQDIRDTVRDLPLDRLLVETDSPYLAPVPRRGKRNEPAFVAHTAAVLAEVKGVTPAEIARITTENFLRLFSRVPQTMATA